MSEIETWRCRIPAIKVKMEIVMEVPVSIVEENEPAESASSRLAALAQVVEKMADMLDALIKQVGVLDERQRRVVGEANFEERILREKHAARMLGISPSTMRNRCTYGHPSYDPDFPKPIYLSSGKNRSAMGWRLSDLLAWIRSRPVALLAGQLDSQRAAGRYGRKCARSDKDFSL